MAWERNSRVFIPVNVFKNSIKLDEKGKPNYASLKILNEKDNSEYFCQPIASDSDNKVDPFPAGWWTVVTLKPLSFTHISLTILDDQESKKISIKSNFNFSNDTFSNDSITIKIKTATF